MSSTIGEQGYLTGVDTSSDVPFYRQIIQQIEQGILSGKLKSGDRLPTIRALAVTLKINPNTIAKAYAELELKGVVITQVGSGTFVSEKQPPPDNEEREMKITSAVARCVRELIALGVPRSDVPELVKSYMEVRE